MWEEEEEEEEEEEASAQTSTAGAFDHGFAIERKDTAHLETIAP